jgi:hypothetical protein
MSRQAAIFPLGIARNLILHRHRAYKTMTAKCVFRFQYQVQEAIFLTFTLFVDVTYFFAHLFHLTSYLNKEANHLAQVEGLAQIFYQKRYGHVIFDSDTKCLLAS